MENTKAIFNGIVQSDSDTIVSMQYGSNGTDPRACVTMKFDFHHLSDIEFSNKFSAHPYFNEMVEIKNDLLQFEKGMYMSDPYFQGVHTIQAPFIFKEKTISRK